MRDGTSLPVRIFRISGLILLIPIIFFSAAETRVYPNWDWENGQRTLKICIADSSRCPENITDAVKKAIDNWNEKLVSWDLIYTEDCEEADVKIVCGGIGTLGNIEVPLDQNGRASGARISIGSDTAVNWGYCDDAHEVLQAVQHELGHAMRLAHGDRDDTMWEGRRYRTEGHTIPISPDDSTEAATSDGNQNADMETDPPGTTRGIDYNGVITPSSGTDPFNFSAATAVDLQAFRPGALNILSWSVIGEDALSWSCHALPHADDTEAIKLYISYPESVSVRQGYICVVDPWWDMMWRPDAVAPSDTLIEGPDTLAVLYDTLSTHPAGRDVVDFWWMIDDQYLIFGDSLFTTGLSPGQHFAALHAIDHAGFRDTDTIYIFVEDYTDTGETPPAGSYLRHTYPNPFNPSATIEFGIEERAHVSLKIYNTAGQLVATLCDRIMEPDVRHTITWDGRNREGRPVASGVYFCRLNAGDFVASRKLVLLR
jgi:hypothetical protein